MRRSLLFALPALALTCLAALPGDSFAQRRGGGGGGRAGGGGARVSGYRGGGGYYNNSAYRGGYGYNGYGSGGGFNNGLGFGLGTGLGYGLASSALGYGGYGLGYGGYGRGYGGYYGSGYGGYGGGYYGSGYSGSGYYPGYSNTYPSDGYSTMPADSVAGGTGAGYQSFYPPNFNGQTNDGTRATIRVHVPPDAQVMFEGSATSQTGSERVFITPPLEGNSNYSYKVSARWRQPNGEEVNRTETVRFSAGRTVDVDFMSAQNQSQPKTLRPTPAGGEEQSEPAPGRRPQQELNSQPTVPANPGNATPPTETRPERPRQPDR